MPFGVDYGETERRLAIAIAEAGGGGGGEGSGTVTVSNFPATQNVAGTVNVGNFPATQPVSGSVSVGNFPATQPISGTVGITQPTAISSGRTTVTTAGTRVQMASVVLTSGATIKALPTNTGLIYVGNVGVTSANGFILSARESVFIAADNLNRFYIDSSVNGEGVSYLAS